MAQKICMISLEAAVIQVQFLEKDGEFTKLCAPLDGALNPDMSAFGFTAYLELPKQVQSSNHSYLHHG